MSACSFNRLLQFVNKQLDLDRQLEVYDHLDECGICRDAVYHLMRDLDGASFVHRPRRRSRLVVQSPGRLAVAGFGSGR